MVDSTVFWLISLAMLLAPIGARVKNQEAQIHEEELLE